MKNKELYFIAILPPQRLQHSITTIKYQIANRYNSWHSLQSPPHITLQMPFKWRVDKENELTEGLQQFAMEIESFTIQLNGFNSFPPRVIYIDVVPSPELHNMKAQLATFLRKNFKFSNTEHKSGVFKPHVTVAFRDLNKTTFARVWEEFRDRTFEATFIVNSLSLLKHNGKAWEVFRHHSLLPASNR